LRAPPPVRKPGINSSRRRRDRNQAERLEPRCMPRLCDAQKVIQQSAKRTTENSPALGSAGIRKASHKSGSVSPPSGRMIVAQQFTAGMRSGRIVVREADGWNGSRPIDAVFSRPFHGLQSRILAIPAMNRWAIFTRPLKRGLGRNSFCAKLLIAFKANAIRKLRAAGCWRSSQPPGSSAGASDI